MSQSHPTKGSYQGKIVAYHYLPTLSVLVLLAVFVAVYFSTSGNYLIAGVSAAIPSVLILWRWIIAGRQVDCQGCPNCLQPFPKKLYWKYPPSICPRCGKPVI